MKKIYIKNRIRREGQYQFFMHQFVEECIKNGIRPKPECHLKEKWHLRGFLFRLSVPFYRFIHKYFKFLLKRDKAILVTSSAGSVLWDSFPYFLTHRIILMLWDVWPERQQQLYSEILLVDCNLCFVTVKQMVQDIKSKLNIQAYWVPEGIDKNEYCGDKNLKERDVDVYEMGRGMPRYHELLLQGNKVGIIKKLLYNRTNPDGSLKKDGLVFKTFVDLRESLSSIKAITCFPMVDTNPEKAGGLETLTQRYWEAMLSRCLMIGRAPKELIDLIGYNPVINVDWENPLEQLREIFDNIESYQQLVNKNFEIAQNKSSWEGRVKDVLLVLESNGYYK